MPVNKKNYSNLVPHLQSIAMQTGKEKVQLKKYLLKQLADNPPRQAKELLRYHDCLLAMMAYPENNEILEETVAALSLLNRNFRIIFSDGKNRIRHSLNGTGISGSTIIGSFSFAIVKWLVLHFPDDVEIDSSHSDPESIRMFFREVLPRTEYENIYASELNLLQRIRKLKGKTPGSALSWLVHHIDTTLLPDRDKESVFHNLQLFIKWELNHPSYNRTAIRGLSSEFFYHTEILHSTKIKSVISQKLPAAKVLSQEEKQHLINVARSLLVFLYRETEPFTYADTNEITFFELERGISIALYGMNPGRRLSIESYIGYLAFKNSIPVAYGGGWIFGRRCQFGINILPAFRGAESSLIFNQLLRVYKQYYKAGRFVVKPYQFGKNNKEALQSGAFWFYYKAGFRPEEKKLHQLAITEWKKKQENKNYRTPISLLKKFTSSNLFLDISKNIIPLFDSSVISIKITDFINNQFMGKRDKAIKVCTNKTKNQLGLSSFKRWNMYERKAFKEWSLLIQAVLELSKWEKQNKISLARLIKSKGSSPERDFILQLQKHKPFWQGLTRSVKQELV